MAVEKRGECVAVASRNLGVKIQNIGPHLRELHPYVVPKAEKKND